MVLYKTIQRLVAWICFPVVLKAQIATDGSIGPEAQVLSGPYYLIDEGLGERSGSHLFHSFRTFSLNSGESATFRGASSITRIISRVTGGITSHIDGLLSSEITNADVFFMNPAGVVFGPNANVSVTGAFSVTTAAYIKFQNNERFYSDSAQSSVLSVAAPNAFGFLEQAPAAIILEGLNQATNTGGGQSQLDVDDASSLNVQNNILSLIGGDITIERYTLNVQNGRLNLASVRGAGEVVLSQSDVILNADPGAITLQTDSRLRSNDGGSIYIRAGQLVMDDNSSATAVVDVATAGGVIDVDVTGLELTRGSMLKSGSLDPDGIGGILSIQVDGHASFAEQDRFGLSNLSGIFQSSGENSSGNQEGGTVGTIFVKAGSLTLDTAIIQEETFGTGSASSIALEVSGAMKLLDGSLIVNETLANGASGSIIVGAGSLLLAGSSRISTSTDGPGTAGLISITGGSVTLDSPSGIVSDSGANATGRAGDIEVNVEAIHISKEGIISAQSRGVGNAGHITIDAQNMYIDGEGASDLTGLSAGSLSQDAGNSGIGGDINITVTGQLTLLNGGTISANTFGSGDGGSIIIEAGNLRVDGGDSNSSSGISAESKLSDSNSGDSGRLTVSAGVIEISNGAVISTATKGGGNAGDIIIGQSAHLIIGPNNIITENNTLAFNNPERPTGRLILNGGSIETSSDFAGVSTGRAGSIKIAVTDEVQLLNTSLLNASTDDGSPKNDSQVGSILIRAPTLVYLLDSTVTSSAAGGDSNGGNISIDPELVVLNNSNITAQAFGGNGGNITIVTDHFFTSSGSVVTASSQGGIDGNIVVGDPADEVTAELLALSTDFLNPDTWVAESCSARVREPYRSSFSIVGHRSSDRLAEDLWPSDWTAFFDGGN